MTELLVNTVPRRLRALYTLIRVVPLLCWGISSSLVGLGFAYTYNIRLGWINYGLVFLLIILIHGVISHAYNDREDWMSGTDPLSPGVLSGGSKVIAQSLYRLEELSGIARSALLLVLIISTYFWWNFGPSVLIFFCRGYLVRDYLYLSSPPVFVSSFDRRMAMCFPCRLSMYSWHFLCAYGHSIPNGSNWRRNSCPPSHGFVNAPSFE